MKKKVLSALLVAAMSATMLAGCTNGGSSKGDDNVVNIYRCTYNLGNVDQDQVQKVEDAINAALKAKGSSVQVNINDIVSGEYGNKASLAMASGECDLLWNASWWDSGIGTNDLYANGSAYDLTDIIKGSTLESSMDAGVWEASKYDGKIYFVPVYKESYEGYDLKTPASVVDKYGWDLSKIKADSTIKTLKNLEPMLAELKADGYKYPYTSVTTAMFYRYYIDKYDFFTQNALFAVDRASNTVINPIQTADYKEFVTLMSEWAEAGYISQDEVTKATDSNVAQSSDWGFTWWTCVPGDEANSESRDNQDEYIIDGVTGKYMHSTTTLGSCFTVNSSCSEAKAKAAVEFLGYLYTDNEIANLYTYGIEGEDYTLVDGRVDQTSQKYNHAAWESTSVKVLTLTKTEDADKVQQYVDMNGSAATSCAAGFRFDKSSVEAEYTACISIMDEYGYNLENGGFASADVQKTIDEYQSKLDAAGYQKVLAEFQAQYDAWKK